MFLSKTDGIGPAGISTASGLFSFQCFSVRGMKLLHWICDGHCSARLVKHPRVQHTMSSHRRCCLQHIRVPQTMLFSTHQCPTDDAVFNTSVSQTMLFSTHQCPTDDAVFNTSVPQMMLFSTHQSLTDDAVFPTDYAVFSTSESHRRCCLPYR